MVKEEEAGVCVWGRSKEYEQGRKGESMVPNSGRKTMQVGKHG